MSQVRVLQGSPTTIYGIGGAALGVTFAHVVKRGQAILLSGRVTPRPAYRSDSHLLPRYSSAFRRPGSASRMTPTDFRRFAIVLSGFSSDDALCSGNAWSSLSCINQFPNAL
ncbi:DUF1515 domain-containing protein [Sinorhizobium meliloti]|nr:DUF1515 family protein [Sinorhizobium meliloti]MCO6426052.1 DUF1515 domain-containing protein [Sinorhizobium meliloti]